VVENKIRKVRKQQLLPSRGADWLVTQKKSQEEPEKYSLRVLRSEEPEKSCEELQGGARGARRMCVQLCVCASSCVFVDNDWWQAYRLSIREELVLLVLSGSSAVFFFGSCSAYLNA
jgi:hypothetical protein